MFALGLAVCVSRLLTRWPRGAVDEIAQRRQAVLLLLWVSHADSDARGQEDGHLVVLPRFDVPRASSSRALPSRLFRLIFRGAPRQKRLALALACLATAIVLLLEVYFQVHFQQQSAGRGEMVVLVPRLSVNAAGSPFGTLITLPLGYRREIVGTLVREFGVKNEAFFRNVHGAVLGLAEENRYLVDDLSSRPAATSGGRPCPLPVPTTWLPERARTIPRSQRAGQRE